MKNLRIKNTATGEEMGDALLTDHEIDVYHSIKGYDVWSGPTAEVTAYTSTFFALTEFRRNFVELFFLAGSCLETPPCAGRRIAERGESVSMPRFSPDGNYLAVGTGDDKVAWYNLANSKLKYERTIGSSEPREGPTAIAFSPDSKLVAVAGVGQGEYNKYGLLLIYDVETGKRERKVKPHLVDWRVSLLEFSPDGKTLMFGGSEGTFKFYDMASATVRATSRQFGYNNVPGYLDTWLEEGKLTAFSPDSRYFAFGRTFCRRPLLPPDYRCMSDTEFGIYNTTTAEPIEDEEILDSHNDLFAFSGDQLVRAGSQRGESSQLDGAIYRHPKNSQIQLVNIATEEDCTHMPTMAPTLSSAPTLAPTLAPTTYQSDAAPARAVVLPVALAVLAAAVI